MATFSDNFPPPANTLALRLAQVVLNRVPFGSQVAGMTPPPVAFRFDTPLAYLPPPTLSGVAGDYYFGV